MVGPGHFIKEFGWKGFFIAFAFVLLTDYILEKFIESEKIRKGILYAIATIFAVLMFYFKGFEKLK